MSECLHEMFNKDKSKISQERMRWVRGESSGGWRIEKQKVDPRKCISRTSPILAAVRFVHDDTVHLALEPFVVSDVKIAGRRVHSVPEEELSRNIEITAERLTCRVEGSRFEMGAGSAKNLWFCQGTK